MLKFRRKNLHAQLLRMKVLTDAAYSVGYKLGFGKNPNCICPSRYFDARSYFEAGFAAGQRDYKQERI